jgi:hypothetical protein
MELMESSGAWNEIFHDAASNKINEAIHIQYLPPKSTSTHPKKKLSF